MPSDWTLLRKFISATMQLFVFEHDIRNELVALDCAAKNQSTLDAAFIYDSKRLTCADSQSPRHIAIPYRVSEIVFSIQISQTAPERD